MRTLRLPQVKAKTGLSKSRIYALIKEEKFPRPGKVGDTSLWFEDELDEWAETIRQLRAHQETI